MSGDVHPPPSGPERPLPAEEPPEPGNEATSGHGQEPESGSAPSPFAALRPEVILDAVEGTGRAVTGRLMALNSYENRVWHVELERPDPALRETPLGDAVAPGALVVKLYRPGRWSDAGIEEEHAFAWELARAEIPVVPPLPDAGGRTLHRHAGFRFALYPAVGGRAPQLDRSEALEQLGRLVARIHALGALREFRHRPRVDVERLGWQALERLRASALVPPDLLPAWEAAASEVLAKVERAFETVAPEVVRLHGDLHPGNILVEGERLYVVDLDDAAMGPRIQDLWMFLSGDRAYAEARLGELVGGYLDFEELDLRELALVEPLRALRMIHYEAWLAERHREPTFAAAFPWFRERTHWDRHVLDLREQSARLDEPPLVWRPD